MSSLLSLFLLACPLAPAQTTNPVPPTPALSSAAAAPPLPALTANEIVQRMIARNRQRAESLRSYTETRHYTVAYTGFPASLRATMTVAAVYTAPSTKTFHILSHSGPQFLVDRVLMRLLASEAEAARNPSEASLTPANYTFTLAGAQTVQGRPCYLMNAEPKQDSKFLFRGRICVDAQDYAVSEIDARPARNPSFWIAKTQIHHVYDNTGAFWLPAENLSRSSIRIGGTATLTIDYGTPRIGAAPVDPLASSPVTQPETPVPATASRQ